MRILTTLSAVLILLSISSCSTPVQYSATNQAFLDAKKGERIWRKIAILPFSGDPAYRRANAEWFAYLIDKHHLFEIVGPSLAEIELGKKGMKTGKVNMPIEEAREAGRLLGADGVIVGSLKTSVADKGDILWGKKVAGTSLVDVPTGQVVATSARSAFLMGTDMNNVASKATEQVVNDLLPALYGLAGKTWTPPPKQEPSRPSLTP